LKLEIYIIIHLICVDHLPFFKGSLLARQTVVNLLHDGRLLFPGSNFRVRGVFGLRRHMVKQFLVFLALGHLQVVVDIFFLLVLILFLIYYQRVLLFLLLLRFL